MRRLNCDRLVVATHNHGKLAEIAALLAPFGVATLSGEQLGLPAPDETADTFLGNARIKAHAAAALTLLPALADDSGLEVAALGGSPGVMTADWADGPDGRDYGKAMRRVWSELKAVKAIEPWEARFRCTLVLAWPDGHEEVFCGDVAGQIVWPVRGGMGHGFDPIFQPDGFPLTFAEMTGGEKNRISHRAVALRRFLEGCFG